MPSRSTLATGPVEDVTPWELAPTPSSNAAAPITEKRPSPRVSTSSSQPKSLSEIAHLRRRKSTGTKAKSRSNTIPGPYTSTQVPEASSVASKHQSVPPPHKLVSSSKPVPTTTKLSHRISVRPAPPIPSPLSEQCPAPPQTNLKFSTADRTILEELKRNLKARESLFVMKGDGTLGSHLGSRGKKHHAYSPNEVPYPRNYEREVIDL
ncbi:hypothetical protein H0H81_003257 [Sphagnurus paluster]|uniref:Uncharacterized protein n=1 Tax=Sphagnurus paluster TaxID=117069 RepID=A0A9P7GQR2_9AGAR|nr:hypothetical protein H0H81_003257 [Sphagnurus paluster]